MRSRVPSCLGCSGTPGMHPACVPGMCVILLRSLVEWGMLFLRSDEVLPQRSMHVKGSRRQQLAC